MIFVYPDNYDEAVQEGKGPPKVQEAPKVIKPHKASQRLDLKTIEADKKDEMNELLIAEPKQVKTN